MSRKPILLTVAALVIMTMACSISINGPVTQVKTGPTVTEEISVPFLEDTEELAHVSLMFGSGTLTLSPGAEDSMISGTATFNVEDFRPHVTTEGRRVRIEQGNLDISGIPDFRDDVINDWNLFLSTAPMELTIEAGAYNGNFELGGLALQSLEISDGAADVEVSFSEPNLVEMDLFTYNTGASTVSISGLANTNCSTFIFRSGAGSYTLDFSGELAQDMTVNLESGLSSLTIIMPEGTATEVRTEGGMLNVSTSGGWDRDGDDYVLSGDGYVITILVKMGAGSLTLTTE